MRAVLRSAFTGPEELQIGEIEEPKPASDEILIDVHAASVSFMDHLLVSGGYQMRPPTPFVPGTEGAGIVIAVGERVRGFRSGDRVACGTWTGGYAERMVAKEWKCVRLPVRVDFETAAAVWHNYGTITPLLKRHEYNAAKRCSSAALQAGLAWRPSTSPAI